MRHSLNKGGESQTGTFWNEGEMACTTPTETRAVWKKGPEGLDRDRGGCEHQPGQFRLEHESKAECLGLPGLGKLLLSYIFPQEVKNGTWAGTVSRDLRPVSCILSPQDVQI